MITSPPGDSDAAGLTPSRLYEPLLWNLTEGESGSEQKWKLWAAHWVSQSVFLAARTQRNGV